MMCRRYSFSDNLAELARALGVSPIPLERRYNVVPLSTAPVVIQRPAESPRIEMMNWGLVPWWARDDSGAAKMTTAGCETLGERPALRAAYHQRRCLVISDGFYEWQQRSTTRQPWRFSLPDHDFPMILAGVWESWRPVGAPAPLCTYSILTTTANGSVAEVSDRMPVILDEKHWAVWLNPTTPMDRVQEMLRPWPHRLEMTPVSPQLDDPQFQGKQCHEPHDLGIDS